jgi:hypothetical protein
MAHSIARVDAQSDAVVRAFPAWRLSRFGDRKDPRDWQARWAAAFNECGGKGCAPSGEMVARKDSPIWEKIGAGAGGHKDTLGNPYPPFAFNSGMDWEDVDAEECEALGIDVSDITRPKSRSLGVLPEDIRRAESKVGPDFSGDLDRWARGED